MNTTLTYDFDGDAHFNPFVDRHMTADYNTNFPPLEAFIQTTTVGKPKMDKEEIERSDLADSEMTGTLPSNNCSRSTSWDD